MDAKQLLVSVPVRWRRLWSAPPRRGETGAYVRVAEIEIDPAQFEPYEAAVKEQIEPASGWSPESWHCTPYRTKRTRRACSY